MFVLNGKTLPLDVPFEANGTLYPANWLRLSSPSEREAVGITEVPDPSTPSYDQRFFWGYTASGTLIPKDHDQLVTQWTDTTRQTANTLLAPTDWTIVREIDNGTPTPSGLKSWRQQVRYACEDKVTTIVLTSDTPSLADYITYVSPSGGATTDYNYWPQYPPPSGVTPSGITPDVIVIDGSTSAPVVTGDSTLVGDTGTDTVVL
jgi:hypothetical protein